jgi:predicted Zn-ribbon and HTH transcriptional regulator
MPQKTLKVTVWVCSRCNWEWQSKGEDEAKPLRCSRCKSPYWDREPVRKPKPKTQTKAKSRK